MNGMNKEIVNKIIKHFEIEPQTYLPHTNIRIDGIDDNILERHIKLMYEADYLSGYFLEIDDFNGVYVIGGLTAYGKQLLKKIKNETV